MTWVVPVNASLRCAEPGDYHGTIFTASFFHGRGAIPWR
jgi:hypothetical protein